MFYKNNSLNRKAKLLLIEDNIDQIFLIKQSFANLAENNPDVDVVTAGEEAINYVKQIGVASGKKTPDLIILDLKLPKRDGFEVLRQLKTDNNLRSIPVVVFSSSA